METDSDTKQSWLYEAKAMGVSYYGQPSRYLWPWPIDVKVGDVIEHNESRAIWDFGIVFTYSRELPPDTLVMVKRINDRYEEPWVAIRVTSSNKGDKGNYLLDGIFDE